MLTHPFAAGIATGIGLTTIAIALWCWRPFHRISQWADRTVQRDDVTRARPLWWVTQVVFALSIAKAFMLRPRRTAHLWRHRNDPPPRAEPVRFDPEWRTRREATDTEQADQEKPCG